MVSPPALLPSAWRPAAEAHQRRVLSLVGGSIVHDPAHPIFNFLFEYYSFDRNLLLRWSPGPGVTLEGAARKEPILWQGFGWHERRLHDKLVGCVDPSAAKRSMRAPLRRMCRVLRSTEARPPHLNCYGLHEWAMLYKPSGAPAPVRHQSLALRLPQAPARPFLQDEINAVVESVPIACTHFDAFRFFAAAAVPLNTVEPTPTRETQPLLEQPGCVHATMDLFRYSLKLWPFLPAELLADTLELAVCARVLDMRASPYDLSAWDGKGFDLTPIRIETAAGRKQYQRQQASLVHRSTPLRRRLIEYFEHAESCWGNEDASAS
ncbi:hypothetical protein AB1Y20_013914 [Prymnesium parvum]|uniref:3-methyladenine DNA glycosylase n=1 Tax=Prymnesium parvum TaxID=97485 RepID=A0AB34IGU8_PRYPA